MTMFDFNNYPTGISPSRPAATALPHEDVCRITWQVSTSHTILGTSSSIDSQNFGASGGSDRGGNNTGGGDGGSGVSGVGGSVDSTVRGGRGGSTIGGGRGDGTVTGGRGGRSGSTVSGDNTAKGNSTGGEQGAEALQPND